jgi:hypothetical protein
MESNPTRTHSKTMDTISTRGHGGYSHEKEECDHMGNRYDINNVYPMVEAVENEE